MRKRILAILASLIGALGLTLGLATSASAGSIYETYGCGQTDHVSATYFYHCDGYWWHNWGYPTRELRIVSDQTWDSGNDWHTTRITRLESRDGTYKRVDWSCQNASGRRGVGSTTVGGTLPSVYTWSGLGFGSVCDGYATGITARVADSTGAYVTWVVQNVTGHNGSPGHHAGWPEVWR